ncbi:metalloregulator ArsR/SmtB family transcription factor (plasmid) [Methylobacterium currus]|uniref:ArsR/SmtB family transcription factor n=1 Tax=Methylobacterium currus TaxID=2051553 RepID=UPI001E44F593|nr:metalloregulator ArsR/SmtB family transcription factor [Methylobacterium currus]UHC20002.1 metalloregulator ArsR/SmtB family transcription factor [Methylobacterium currus]
MLNENDALTVLSALAQEARLRAMRTPLRNHPSGLAAGRIATEVDSTSSTMSFHLAQLERAGLIRSRRQANQVIYTAVPEALGSLLGYLLDECCSGRPELCAEVVKAALGNDRAAFPVSCGGPARPKA